LLLSELCREQARGWNSSHATSALAFDTKVPALTGADFETLSYIEHNCTTTVRESGWLYEPGVAERPSYPC